MSNSDNNKMRRFLKKCDIVVTKKNCGNSRPCVRCLDFMKSVGVRRIYYSYEQEFKMEKIKVMESSHISSRYRKPWSMQTGEKIEQETSSTKKSPQMEKKEIKKSPQMEKKEIKKSPQMEKKEISSTNVNFFLFL